MGRILVTDVFNENNKPTCKLDELIPAYAMNKQELDSYSALCESEKTEIKGELERLGQDEYTAGDHKVKQTVSVRETMNTAKLLEVVDKYNIPGVTETVRTVNMDALEDYLYANQVSPEFMAELDACRIKTEVVSLRLSKAKRKKAEDDE